MDHIDMQGGLRVPVKQVNKPCEECGASAPALEWSVPGILSGVLCRACLDKVVAQINGALKATSQEGK